MKTSTAIRNILILSKNCEKSAQFFVDILGLKINHMSRDYAELVDKNNSKIVFKKTLSEAQTKIGYSPFITFNVESYDLTIEKLKSYEDEIEFDGEPIDNELGKVR
jgi:DNA phosphorothioation-dependent restriction protein DptG